MRLQNNKRPFRLSLQRHRSLEEIKAYVTISQALLLDAHSRRLTVLFNAYKAAKAPEDKVALLMEVRRELEDYARRLMQLHMITL